MILKVYDSVSTDRSEDERKKVENGVFRSQYGSQKVKENAESIDK